MFGSNFHSGLPGPGVRASPRPVYVVDDDSMVRRSLFFALNAAGFAPRSFSSGVDFLEQVEGLVPGCVLLDLRMPELDGIAVLERLGARSRCLPVVMITGHGEIESAVKAMKCGASDFLEKPCKDTDLVTLLEGLFLQLPGRAAEEAQISDSTNRVGRITNRERDVLQGLVDGLSNKDLARQLELSARTVEVHRANLMRKLGAGSVGEAIRIALLSGIKPSTSTVPTH